MPPHANEHISQLRRYRALADRYLSLVAKEQGMHATDTSALSHLLDQKQRGTVLSAGELGELLSLSGPATTAAIDRLEGHGLVERRHSAVDGRRVEVHLTPDVVTDPGKTVFADMGQAIAKVMKGHSAEEQKAFHAILTEICDAVADLNAKRSGR